MHAYSLLRSLNALLKYSTNYTSRLARDHTQDYFKFNVA